MARRVPTVSALGECLPFPDGAFDVVLCDNVIDHAKSPAATVAELA
jgi:ubiquinone/menaquinone biosynthesis C-methylase UbiE